MCDALSSGRADKCNTSNGGNSYVIVWDKVADPFTIVAGECTAINAAITTAYKYEIVKDTSTLDAVTTTDNTTGTRVSVSTLSMQLKQVDAATNVELDKMGNAQMAIIDRQGQATAIAIEDGFKTFEVTRTSGAARTDFNGYTLSAVAETNQSPPILDAATKTALEALLP